MFFTKKVKVPTEGSKELDAVQLWAVRWNSRHGDYSHDIRKEVEVFTSEADARVFAHAFELTRTTSNSNVQVTKN